MNFEVLAVAALLWLTITFLVVLLAGPPRGGGRVDLAEYDVPDGYDVESYVAGARAVASLRGRAWP